MAISAQAKETAIRLIEQGNYTAAAIAEKAGISKGLVYKLRRELKPENGPEPGPGPESEPEPLPDDVASLQALVARYETQIDTLFDVVAILTRQQHERRPSDLR